MTLNDFIAHVACHNVMVRIYLLVAESSWVLTRTQNLLLTVTLVFIMRVTVPPSFTGYTSGSKYTPATTHKGRGPSSEVNRKVVAMQSRKSYVAAAIVAEPAHLSFASSRTPTVRVVGRQAAIYTCALFVRM